MSNPQNGAAALLNAAYATGIRVCFANPGTTELDLVRALDDVPGVRPILGLFEGVCTGAADGYARVSGLPALTLLHLGPGFANGLANLHNARRAHSPIVNIVGDHATWHLPFDAPLTSDIESLARPMCARVIRIDSASTIVQSVRDAVADALAPPGSVVTLIAPSDLMEKTVQDPPEVPPSSAQVRSRQAVPARRVQETAARLLQSESTVILLGGDSLCERGQRAARRISESTGARLVMESYPPIVALGGDLPPLERLAYFPQDVIEQLKGAVVMLAGARAPVSYFGYTGQPSKLVADCQLVELSSPAEDGVHALETLAGVLPPAAGGSPARRSVSTQGQEASVSNLSPVAVAEELARQMPEDAIVSLEGSTCGGPYLQRAHRAARHRVMTNTGGAIGQGIPCAVGAAVAAPEARVICLQSDGSAQYTLQALWTLAREALDVTVIICANHRYGILQTELRRAGADTSRPALARLTCLDEPRLDWLALAQGYGVPCSRAATPAEFREALRIGLKSSGPYLIEAQLE